MNMNLKFLAPPFSVAFLLLGLSYVDASPIELVTGTPASVELPAGNPTNSYKFYFVFRENTDEQVAEVASNLSFATEQSRYF